MSKDFLYNWKVKYIWTNFAIFVNVDQFRDNMIKQKVPQRQIRDFAC